MAKKLDGTVEVVGALFTGTITDTDPPPPDDPPPPSDDPTPPPPSPGVEAHERFVSKIGNDNNDGFSLGTAKQTIEAAVQSLPEQGGGGGLRRSGDVHIGSGLYVTSETIECSSDIRFYGAGVPVGESTGTVVKIGHDGHGFAPRSTFSDWGHNIIFENLGIRGDGRSGEFDLVRILRGGFNTSMRNVRLDGAPRHGLFLMDNAVNFFGYNLAGAGCKKSFLTLSLGPTASLATVGLFGIQVDDCGQYPIQVDNSSSGTGSLSIHDAEFEAGPSNQHESLIVHNPIAGANGIAILVDGLQAWKNGGGGDAVLKELSGSGSAAWWNWRNALGDGYDNTYHSDKTGVTHSGIGAKFFGSVGRNAWHEMRLGSVAVATGPGDPTGGNQPDGSLFIRTNGELWTKVAGAWKKAAI